MEHEDSLSLMQAKDGGLFQSEEWRRFQESAGFKTIRFRSENLEGRAVFHSLPFAGGYLYFPRGPLFFSTERKKIDESVLALKELGKKEKVNWIRIEPQDDEVADFFSGRNDVRKSPRDTQPREIFSIDISSPEETLLSRMKQKTRYNIRLAEKKGVKVIVSNDEKYKQSFLRLVVETADRKIISPHPRHYYEKFFSSFPEGTLSLFIAEYGQEVIAANLLAIYGNTAYYLHGGSSDRHRDVMAPYLLQWEQIRFAKEKGATKYDFGGIKTDENSEGKSGWAGITRFKQGFDPKQESIFFPGTYDIVINKKRYLLYIFLQSVKKFLKFHKR